MSRIQSTVNDIFAACPELFGFSVGQLEGELCLAEVETAPYAASEEIVREVAEALVALIDDEPEAADLLRGRTFARTLH